MTTTPSPELPDLDRLEALAKAMLNASTAIKAEVAQQEFHEAASPAAVLALIALARRAQPEGMSIALREVTDKLSAASAENLSLGMENRQLREQLEARAQPEGEAPQAAPLRADHRATIEEAAQVLESAAAHNRFKGRTVLEHQQQDRADRLRAILSVQHATPSTASRDAHQLASLILQDPDGGRMVISSPLESGADGAMWFTATNPETRASARITISIEHDYDPATAQHAEIGAPAPNAERVDAIVTGLYRRFKDWSKRGFGPDDVTWCEVKADIIALIAAGAAESGAPVAILTGEQLYTMVTSRFKSGSFPWSMVAESGKAAWNAAAADLTFAPDTIGAALAAQSQGAQAAPGIVITLRQAHRLVEFFGGHDARVTITPPRAEWGDMPPGLYAFCTEYPEDGSEHLGETEVDDDLSSLGERGRVARAALAAKAEEPAPRIIGGQRWSKEAEMTEGWLAAQQAAAPCSLDPNVFFDALSDFEDSPMSVDEKKAFFDKLAASPSAPGTPEAPAGELERLRALLNTPELHDFSKGVVLEATHQRERWSTDNDAGKQPADWFWLLGYLGGKALRAHIDGDTEKALHHTISTAAACANWHAAVLGKTSMRPGIEPPAEIAAQLDGGQGEDA